MFTLLRYLTNKVRVEEKKFRVILAGLERGGKSYVHKKMRRYAFDGTLGDVEESKEDWVYVPSIGQSNFAWRGHNGYTTYFVDIGGNVKVRLLWKDYFEDCSFVVWVAHNRWEESADLLGGGLGQSLCNSCSKLFAHLVGGLQ